MAGPDWSDDHPSDRSRIAANVASVVADVTSLAGTRGTVTADVVKRWHADLYAGCTVPASSYLGTFRGEAHPDIVDYEVGVGPTMPDGYPDRVGVWAADVSREAGAFFASLDQALSTLDAVVPLGARPDTVDLLEEVITTIAVVHGEWVRIHPFVNGNGRTARLLAAHISLRYGLPVFVALKPRPHDVAYARASRSSMGRPPDFTGGHQEALAVFSHLLTLHLLGP